jgi:hypothetical protein
LLDSPRHNLKTSDLKTLFAMRSLKQVLEFVSRMLKGHRRLCMQKRRHTVSGCGS